jgi:hypothetical protein
VLKTVKLALSEFPAVPTSLSDPATGQALGKIPVNLADLYTHYYLDSWGEAPPNPDPAHFEQVRYLLPCAEFRFAQKGMGAARTFKGNKSNELGQAFCRWFLSEHLNIDYIAHIDDVRSHGALEAYGGVSVETNDDEEGDRPDYFCASGPNQIYLAEAKGSRHAVGFTTKEFQRWRDQFQKVVVKDANGDPLSVKGFIVAMRWAMENDSTKVSTQLSAEDPETRGVGPVGEDRPGLALATKSIHYAASFQRLQLPLIGEALRRGFIIPNELLFRRVIWQCVIPVPPYSKLRFVGGYYPEPGALVLPWQTTPEGQIKYTAPDMLRLDIGSGTFFGIEETTFKTLAAAARQGSGRLRELRPLEGPRFADSSVSLLRDGHVIGPIEFFRPVDIIEV